LKVIAPAALEKVRIENKGIGKAAKFIIAEMKKGDNPAEEVLRADGLASFHKDIYQALLVDTDYKYQIKVNGGGKLYYSEYDKTIWVWGASHDYGPPEYQLTIDLLEKRYPDYKITLAHMLDKGELKSAAIEYISIGDMYKFWMPVKELGKNEKIIDGKTAMHLAIEFGHIDIVKKLLDEWVKLDIKDDKNRTALQFAAFLVDTDRVAAFFEKKDVFRYIHILELLKQLTDK
jgi:hypothetical protein